MKKHLPVNWTFTLSISISLVALPFGLVRAVETNIVIDNTLNGVNHTLPHTVPDPHTGGTIHPIGEGNGQAAGHNLFYSFRDFNVGSGDTAYFNLIQNWENVIARVTGGSVSFIDGTLRVSGARVVDTKSSNNLDTSPTPDFVDGIAGATTIAHGAKNFFFINPAGIVFGPGSVVDVPGSFYASTASTLKFKDGAIYGEDLQGNPVSQLTASAPDAFGFLGNETGALVLDHATIQVFNDETLALVGHDIRIDNSSKIGQVDLMRPQAGFNQSGLPLDPNHFDPTDPSTFPRFVAKSDLFIDGIQLLLFANHGKHDIGIFSNNPNDFPDQNGDPDYQAFLNHNNGIRNALNFLDGNINISNTDLINAGGDAEEITLLRGGNINLNNASIVSSNYGDDCGGICGSDATSEPVPGISGIDILATGKLTLNKGHIVTETAFSPVNPAVDNVAINIQAASMLMDNHSSVSTKSLNLRDVNRDYVPDGIYPVPHPLDPPAGNINIKVVDEHGNYGNFTAQGGSSVESSTETFGDAGKINIEAGSITLNKASIKSDSTSSTNGLTGYLKQDNGNILRDDNAYIGRDRVYTLVSENHDLYTLPFTERSATLPDQDPINVPLFLIDHTKNAGAAGTISLTAHNGDISLANHSTVSTDISSGTSHTEAAKISLNAGGSILMDDGSKVTSTTSGDAKAGDIQLTAANSITLNNASEVTTDTKGVNDGRSGDGGAISTHSKSLAINAGSLISSSTYGLGEGGTISTHSKSLSINSGSFISSSTYGLGKAGTVNVEAETVMINGLWPIPVNHLGRYFDENFTGIRTIAGDTSGGQTGNIDINTSGNVYMSNGAQISISNLATVDQARLSSLHKTHINLNASSVYLTNSQIVADSTGNVDAGDINIIFKEWLKLDPSAISTIAFDGNGGNIKIGGGNFIWLQDSMVTTSVLGLHGGKGGDTDMQSNFLIMDSGFIQANTAADNASGGLVNINVGTLIPSGGILFVGGNAPYQFQPFSGINVIQAAAPGGVSGQVNTTPPQLNLSGTLANLIVHSFDPNAISRALCAIGENSSLSQSGKGGLRRQAKDPLLSTNSPLSLTY